MAGYNSFTQEKNLYATVYSELKTLGVKVPKPKKLRSIASKFEISMTEKGSKIFGVSLRDQEWTSNGKYSIPKFIELTTDYLQKYTQKEIGIFRKGGNIARQKRLRTKIEKGESIEDVDPNDVACLLKQWLRELPDPLIPTYLQDLFIRCQSLESEKDRETACLLAFLLLPPDHQHTLKHLLHFFASIADESEKNKMGTYNLALILAPNIFALQDTTEKARNDMVLQYAAVIETLILNADKIGTVQPSLSFQKSLLGSELAQSVDVLDHGPGKYKKRKSGTVQDLFSGFKRLVGQTSSTKAISEVDLVEAQARRQALSMDNLENTTFETPKNKSFTIPDKSSSRHARRKSFGALLLRKRDKKGNQVPRMQTVDIPIDTPKKTTSDRFESKCQLNFKFTSTLQRNDEMSDEVNSVEDQIENVNTLNSSVRIPVISIQPERISVVQRSESVLKFTDGVKNAENVTHTVQTSSSEKPTLNVKSQTLELTSTYKSGLSRKEAFSIKPPKSDLQTTDQKSDTDLKSGKSSSTESIGKEITDAPLSQNDGCFHSHSACTLKCVKNKSNMSEKRSNKSKSKRETLSKRRPQSLKLPRQVELPCSNELQQASRVTSHQNLSSDSLPISELSHSPKEVITASSVPQSLDVSLNMMMQNFCASPKVDIQEFRFKFDIFAPNKIKVNISKKETFDNVQIRNPEKLCDILEQKEPEIKPRKRLSSHSDSRIPRLKRTPDPNRPNSFHGIQVASRRNNSKAEDKKVILRKRPSNIPSLRVEKASPALPKGRFIKEIDSPNDSCFVTPTANLDNTDWFDGSHYLSALSSPDDNIVNKRESIVKILKYQPGHVLSKVSMFDSKGSSESDGEGKLLRTSSEKYSSMNRSNHPKLVASNSYNAVGRRETVRYNQTPRRFQHPSMRTFSFKSVNARGSSPNSSILRKNLEEKSSSDSVSSDASSIVKRKSLEQK